MTVSPSSHTPPLRSWRLSAAGRGDLAQPIAVPCGDGSSESQHFGIWKRNVLVDGFVQQFFSPDSKETYVGRWTETGANGIGALFLSANRYYIGEWKDGKREGLGLLAAPRMRFIGMFRNDDLDQGFMDMRVTKTLRYIGEWFYKTPQGWGISVDVEGGSTQIGQWNLGKLIGGFVEKVPRLGQGSYTGEWGENGPHGRGVWQDAELTSYQGQWEDGQFSGQGRLNLPFGNYYQGQFERHEFIRGTARKSMDDGTVYEGEWKEGRFDGLVTVSFLGHNLLTGRFYPDGSFIEIESCDVSEDLCGRTPSDFSTDSSSSLR